MHKICLATTLTVGLCLCGITRAGVVDQINIPTKQSLSNVANDEMAAQTFTAGLGGKLGSIDLFIGVTGGSANLVVDVRHTSGHLPSDAVGAVLGQSSRPASEIPAPHPGEWVSFSFADQEIDLVAGQSYAIVLSRSFFDYNSVAWWGSLDSYSGGNFYSKQPGSSVSIFTDWYEPFALPTESHPQHLDMGFRTNMGIDVPEPASTALFLTGFALVIVAKRKQTLRPNSSAT